MFKPLWQMWESVVQTLVEVEEVCSGSATQKLQWKQEDGHLKLEELRSDQMTSVNEDGWMWRWWYWWQKGRGHLDPKKQPPGTETMGSPESTEEFPDRMKMGERTKNKKIHKKLEKKVLFFAKKGQESKMDSTYLKLLENPSFRENSQFLRLKDTGSVLRQEWMQYSLNSSDKNQIKFSLLGQLDKSILQIHYSCFIKMKQKRIKFILF